MPLLTYRESQRLEIPGKIVCFSRIIDSSEHRKLPSNRYVTVIALIQYMTPYSLLSANYTLNQKYFIFIYLSIFQAGKTDYNYLVKSSLVDDMSRSEGKNCCQLCCSKLCRRLRSELLLFLILIGVVFGFIVGVFINKPVGDIKDPERRASTLMLIGFPGELFMNMLKMLILPLIIASLVCALAALDAKATSRIGRRALLYYIATTILAVILGISLVVIMRPGKGGKTEEATKEIEEYRTLDAFLDLIRSDKTFIAKNLNLHVTL